VPESHTSSQKGLRSNGSASPGTAIVQDLKKHRKRYIQPRSKHDKEQRTSATTSVNITGSHVTIASASEQRRGAPGASRVKGRSQRSPSQRVGEPRRVVSAAIGNSSRRHRDQPRHQQAVIGRAKINLLLFLEFLFLTDLRGSHVI